MTVAGERGRYAAGLLAYDREAEGEQVERHEHAEGGRDECAYCRGYQDAMRVTVLRATDDSQDPLRRLLEQTHQDRD